MRGHRTNPARLLPKNSDVLPPKLRQLSVPAHFNAETGTVQPQLGRT
jgi:hypothetical protein